MFLNVKLSDSDFNIIVCEFLKGFKKVGKCVILERALYEMRESLFLWYREFVSMFRKKGMIVCKEELCLF